LSRPLDCLVSSWNILWNAIEKRQCENSRRVILTRGQSEILTHE
jgi:hypothetical protein